MCSDCYRKKKTEFTWQTDFFTGRETLYVKDVTIQVRQMADKQSWIASDDKQQFRFVNGSAEGCKKAAEEHAKKVLSSDQNAPWAKKPATEKQLGMLKRFKIPFKDGISSGEASALIGKVFERKGKVSA